MVVCRCLWRTRFTLLTEWGRQYFFKIIFCCFWPWIRNIKWKKKATKSVHEIKIVWKIVLSASLQLQAHLICLRCCFVWLTIWLSRSRLLSVRETAALDAGVALVAAVVSGLFLFLPPASLLPLLMPLPPLSPPFLPPSFSSSSSPVTAAPFSSTYHKHKQSYLQIYLFRLYCLNVGSEGSVQLHNRTRCRTV